MAVQTDFMVAVNQIAAERNIDGDLVIEAIKEAIKTGFQKDNEEEEGLAIDVEIDTDSGSIAVISDKKVVDEVTNEATQISLEDAKKLEPKLRVGDHIQVDITPEGDFGRVAAQAAKQVILQKIREAEKEAQIKEFEDRIGEVETAVVQRMDGDNVLWDINRATALMKAEDRVPTEFYKSGTRHKIYLKAIEEGPRGKVLLISRSDPKFLQALFELEVPELVSGSIEIKSIAREAGSRSKVAVSSTVEGIDPIGSCVGQKGVRINAIMNELKMGVIEEKVDIILWDEDIKDFISNALSPAQPISVKILDKEKSIAQVVVPDDQLSLAIGKDGQNVRLAAKLTGWKLDIQGETVKVEHKEADDSKDKKTKSASKKSKVKKGEKKETELEKLGLGKRIVTALEKAGITTEEGLKEKIKAGEKIAGVGPKAVEEIEAALASSK